MTIQEQLDTLGVCRMLKSGIPRWPCRVHDEDGNPIDVIVSSSRSHLVGAYSRYLQNRGWTTAADDAATLVGPAGERVTLGDIDRGLRAVMDRGGAYRGRTAIDIGVIYAIDAIATLARCPIGTTDRAEEYAEGYGNALKVAERLLGDIASGTMASVESDTPVVDVFVDGKAVGYAEVASWVLRPTSRRR